MVCKTFLNVYVHVNDTEATPEAVLVMKPGCNNIFRKKCTSMKLSVRYLQEVSVNIILKVCDEYVAIVKSYLAGTLVCN